MKKKKVDPVAYAAKVRKEAEKMQAMSEAFGSHTKTPPEIASRRARKSRQT
jgi:hypothetical protein